MLEFRNDSVLALNSSLHFGIIIAVLIEKCLNVLGCYNSVNVVRDFSFQPLINLFRWIRSRLYILAQAPLKKAGSERLCNSTIKKVVPGSSCGSVKDSVRKGTNKNPIIWCLPYLARLLLEDHGRVLDFDPARLKGKILN